MKACRGLHCWSPPQSPASAAPRQCSPHEYRLRQLHSLGGWAGALLSALHCPEAASRLNTSTGSSAGQCPLALMKLQQSLLALIWQFAHCQKTSTMAVRCTEGNDCLEADTPVEDSMLCLLCEGTGLWSWPGLAFTAKSASIMVPLSHGASHSWC
jgi:hypothetical protein